MEVNRKQLITAVSVLAIFLLLATLVINNGPQAKRGAPKIKPVLSVETTTVMPQSYQFTLSSFGTVQPRTQTLLVSQVTGMIVEVNPIFRDGGFFARDEILIRIDDRDYQAAAKVAQAKLLQAQVSLEEEKARASQAKKDWQRLGDGEQAPDLVLRKPQLAAAEAELISAQANYDKAQLDLERTQIRAPFDGRVKTTLVDLGQFVNASSQLAEVFATDVVEIRLPLKNSELSLIDLPENFRGHSVSPEQYPDVIIGSDLGEHQEWQGKIVRTEAAIDENSHQLYVIAQIQDPFAVQQNDKTPLKIGQYVTARITGKTLERALVVPTSSIYQGSYLYTVKDNALQRHDIHIGFQTPKDSVIDQGLNSGDVVITSPLGQVTSGTPVALARTNTMITTRTPSTPPTNHDGEPL